MAQTEAQPVARRYFVRGRVQGVGFRYFVQRAAEELVVKGYTRNLDDGRVEGYAIASPETLADLEGCLWKGPRWSDVRGIDVLEAGLERCSGFRIV